MTSEITPSTPAARLIKRFGAKRLADWTGRHVSRVHSWAWPADRGGTGGLVPARVRSAIIAGARAGGDVLTHADFEPAEGEAYLFEAAA